MLSYCATNVMPSDKPESPYAALPPKIYAWGMAQIEAYVKEHDFYFADNFRMADVGIPEHLEWFEKLKRSGCCGKEEFTVTGYNGRTYLLGFNWGH